MGVPILVAVTVAYLGVAASYWRDRRYGMALAFVGYAIANVGFIWDARR